MLILTTASRFPLGQIVITRNALDRLSSVDIHEALQRHASGVWGLVCPDDASLNDSALEHGDRLLSVYLSGEERFWIITESDRSVTTILMPEDY